MTPKVKVVVLGQKFNFLVDNANFCRFLKKNFFQERCLIYSPEKHVPDTRSETLSGVLGSTSRFQSENPLALLLFEFARTLFFEFELMLFLCGIILEVLRLVTLQPPPFLRSAVPQTGARGRARLLPLPGGRPLHPRGG